ncbi:MAG TPA: SPASM domain-containing protein, partial [Candidatus Krumholzibacteriaceae bacterium]
MSIEGLPATNDQLRGIPDGFDRAMRGILRLKRLGLEDIGFAMTISGENCRDLIEVYTLAASMGIELANAVVHNSFYFYKSDNEIKNVDEVDERLCRFIEALLHSPRSSLRKRAKDWFRAYLNLGLLSYVRGDKRLIPCGAGTDTFFVDPWGRVLACNGSAEPWVMGDLNTQSFDDIWNGEPAREIRARVSSCDRNCWMTGTAVPAMRRAP